MARKWRNATGFRCLTVVYSDISKFRNLISIDHMIIDLSLLSFLSSVPSPWVIHNSNHACWSHCRMGRLITKCCGRAQCGRKVNKSELPEILQLFLIVGYLVGFSHIFIDQSLVYIPRVAYILYTGKFFLTSNKSIRTFTLIFLKQVPNFLCASHMCTYMWAFSF